MTNPNMFISDKHYLNNLPEDELIALYDFLYKDVSMGMEVGQLSSEIEKILDANTPTYKEEWWYQCSNEYIPLVDSHQYTWLRYQRIRVGVKQ